MNNQEHMEQSIIFSKEYLEITVEEGNVYRDHLRFESVDKRRQIVGTMYSTNDKLATDAPSFHGTRIDIPFYFKGKLATAGSTFAGDFVLVTNMGEYNIPYLVTVEPAYMETSMGKIRKLSDFILLYNKDREEAETVFFRPNFPKVFLKDNPELKSLYRSLQKGRRKGYIVEEFLAATDFKDPSRIEVKESRILMDSAKDNDVIHVALKNGGYIAGSISSSKGQVTISKTSFTTDDFTDDHMELIVTHDPEQLVGNDIVIIKTPRETFEVVVEWWGVLPVPSKESENTLRIKKTTADLMHEYLSFRTGSIGFDDFIQDASHGLDDLIFLTGDVRWQLFKMHILLMQDKYAEAKELLEDLESLELKEELSELLYQYYLYLKAMYEKTSEAIKSAVLSLRGFYERSDEKAEALWMLLYLDREYAYNKRLQYETIKQLFEMGNNSALLYYEACEILNDNPIFMEELGNFELGIFRWGLRYGFISMSLAQQFVRLALKIKFFKKSIFYIVKRLYQVEQDDKFLLLICTLLIKGNKTGKEYHEYFKAGVEANLKVVGLSEFFIRSMDFSTYPPLPPRVLIYFTYSNSLDSAEKAYLYVNILKNRNHYDEVFETYYSKMPAFVESQLLKGKINDQLAFLYHYFQDSLLAKPEFASFFCDVMFYQKLVCKNPEMVGVYVVYPETNEEKYHPLSGGEAKIEIFNSRTKYYFVNSGEQRFCRDIEYELIPYMDLGRLPKEWIWRNRNNSKITLMESMKLEGTIEEEALEMAKKIYSEPGYEAWIKERSIEALLFYYGSHNDIDRLKRWLERTDYSVITTGFRERLINYYLTAGMIEKAFFGIELYGSQIVECSKQLEIAEFGIRFHKGEIDDTTLALCYEGMIKGCASGETLKYLVDHFEGELGDYLTLWDRCSNKEIDTALLEERVLRHCIFTGANTEYVYNIFNKFYQTDPDHDIIIPYLAFAAGEDYANPKLPKDLQLIIGKEIMKGKITSLEAKIQILYYFAGRKEEHKGNEDMFRLIIKDLLDQEISLPVYHRYASMVRLPVEFKEKSFLTYLGTPGQQVALSYHLDGEREEKREKLKEILPGRYLGEMYFFKNDHIIYQVEENGEKVRSHKNIMFEAFDCDDGGSRYFTLNRMAKGTVPAETLEAYLRQVYITEHFMSLM